MLAAVSGPPPPPVGVLTLRKSGRVPTKLWSVTTPCVDDEEPGAGGADAAGDRPAHPARRGLHRRGPIALESDDPGLPEMHPFARRTGVAGRRRRGRGGAGRPTAAGNRRNEAKGDKGSSDFHKSQMVPKNQSPSPRSGEGREGTRAGPILAASRTALASPHPALPAKRRGGQFGLSPPRPGQRVFSEPLGLGRRSAAPGPRRRSASAVGRPHSPG